MEETCKEIISAEKIKNYLLKNDYEKFLKWKENQKLNLDENVKWCPKGTCPEYIKLNHLDKIRGYAYCKCQEKICTKCGRKYHGNFIWGTSCEDQLNEEFQDWKKNNAVQTCPNCKAQIEKLEGCNHITCRYLFYI